MRRTLGLWVLLMLLATWVIIEVSSPKTAEKIEAIFINKEKTPEYQCVVGCAEFNATFLRINEALFANTECWCKKGEEPLRIW